MKKKFKLFCFGFGQVGKYFVNNLIKNKFNFSLIATNTNKTKIDKFNNLNYKSYYFKDEKFSLLEKQTTWLLCNNDDRVILIINHRQDSRFQVTEQTTSLIKISLF